MAARPITVHRPRMPANPASMLSAVHSSACRQSCAGAMAPDQRSSNASTQLGHGQRLMLTRNLGCHYFGCLVCSN